MEDTIPLQQEQPVQETGPVYLFSVNTLLTEHEVLLQKEGNDRTLASKIASPIVSDLGEKLKEWARVGFPYMFLVSSFTFGIPNECSDGVKRTLDEYISFLTGHTIDENIQLLQSKLDGIAVHCEYTSPISFNLRVSKA